MTTSMGEIAEAIFLRVSVFLVLLTVRMIVREEEEEFFTAE